MSADQLLLEGQVVVTAVARRHVVALVAAAEGVVERVRYASGSWGCTCPVVGPCAHVDAVRRVTSPGVLPAWARGVAR